MGNSGPCQASVEFSEASGWIYESKSANLFFRLKSKPGSSRTWVEPSRVRSSSHYTFLGALFTGMRDVLPGVLPLISTRSFRVETNELERLFQFE